MRDETVDRLTRRFEIIQRRRGHRAASDDTILAWCGARACPGAGRILDLGTGKGTVAMLLVARLPGCAVVGVEAVAASHDLAVRNAARNGISDRFSPRLGDLRDAAVLAAERPFDLVTGAPPFMPRGTGVLPRDEARAAGRFELRGGVEDYVDTAAGHVSPGGRVVILMDGSEGSRARAVAAFTARGLSVRATLTVSPRPQRPPKYRVFEAARAAGGPVEERSLAMRPADGGAFSPEYEAIRVEMDLA